MLLCFMLNKLCTWACLACEPKCFYRFAIHILCIVHGQGQLTKETALSHCDRSTKQLFCICLVVYCFKVLVVIVVIWRIRRRGGGALGDVHPPPHLGKKLRSEMSKREVKVPPRYIGKKECARSAQIPQN